MLHEVKSRVALRCPKKGISMTTLPTQVVLINGFGLLFVILNTFALGLRLPIGKLLAQFFAHWQIAVWALVINFLLIPLLFIGYLLTVASSIPGQIKVGFCVAALSAGMPFAPLLAKVAKANASVATMLLVAFTIVTIIVLPLGLPLATAAVDSQLHVSVWDVAWPLLLFMLLPLALGIGFRVWWPDLVASLRRWLVPLALFCLLLNLNFTLYAFWNLFVQTWDTGSYIAAVAGPFIGLGCAYLLVSIVRVKDVGVRHAAEITTTIRNIAPMLLVTIFPLAAYPLVNVSITILNSIGIVVVLGFALGWRRASSSAGARATTDQAPTAREPAPEPGRGPTLATG
jgi:BASS family bile acid:Na+ symporter